MTDREDACEVVGHRNLIFCGDSARKFRQCALLHGLRLADSGFRGTWPAPAGVSKLALALGIWTIGATLSVRDSIPVLTDPSVTEFKEVEFHARDVLV